MQTPKVLLDHIDKTKELAEVIAADCKKGDIILLKGNLGSGKTTFSQFFINHFIDEANVTSPTFNIVQIYKNSDISIWHFDLHRLNSASDTYEIGLEEAFDDGITLIEWPEIIESSLKDVKATIELEYNDERSSRSATIFCNENLGEKIINV